MNLRHVPTKLISSYSLHVIEVTVCLCDSKSTMNIEYRVSVGLIHLNSNLLKPLKYPIVYTLKYQILAGAFI